MSADDARRFARETQQRIAVLHARRRELPVELQLIDDALGGIAPLNPSRDVPEPVALNQRLRGTLTRIVYKILEESPERKFTGQDLFLEVPKRRPGTSYRSVRSVLRNLSHSQQVVHDPGARPATYQIASPDRQDKKGP